MKTHTDQLVDGPPVPVEKPKVAAKGKRGEAFKSRAKTGSPAAFQQKMGNLKKSASKN